MALKYLLEFGYMAQRLSVYIVTSQLSIPYSFQTADMQSTVSADIFGSEACKLVEDSKAERRVIKITHANMIDHISNIVQLFHVKLWSIFSESTCKPL